MTDAYVADREQRSSVFMRAEITRQNGDVGEHRVRNLSTTGLCVDNDGTFTVGEKIEVRMGVLTGIGAQVIWLRKELAGLHLDEPVNLQDARKPSAIRAGVSTGWIKDVPDPYDSLPTRSARPPIHAPRN